MKKQKIHYTLCNTDKFLKFDELSPLPNTVLNVRDRSKMRRACMEPSEHKGANISQPNCNKMLIFGKRVFFVMFFRISSQIP